MPGAARLWRQDWESETYVVIQHDLGILKTLAATRVDYHPRFEILQGTEAGTL